MGSDPRRDREGRRCVAVVKADLTEATRIAIAVHLPYIKLHSGAFISVVTVQINIQFVLEWAIRCSQSVYLAVHKNLPFGRTTRTRNTSE